MTDRIFGFVREPEPGGRRETKGKQCERSRYYLKTERTKELTPATDQRKANIHRNKTLKKLALQITRYGVLLKEDRDVS